MVQIIRLLSAISMQLFMELGVIVVSGLKMDSLNISLCGSSFNCLRTPVGCSSLSSCYAIAAFKYVKEKKSVDILLATKHQYVAFAQNQKLYNGGKMVKIRGQYCAKGDRFGNFHGNNLEHNQSPDWITEKIDAVRFIEGNEKDGILTCRYERDTKPGLKSKDYLYDMNEKLYAIMAFGFEMSPEKNPKYHGGGNYLVSEEKVDFLAVQNIKHKTIKVKDIYKAHGIIMIIAYILLATAGIFTSRYLKGVTKDMKVKGKAAWFVVHRLIMIICLLLVIIAFIMILVEKRGWDDHAGRHHYTGLFAVIAFLIQPLMAIARPAPDHSRRPIFNWAHRSVGILGWFLGGLAVVFAFDLLNKEFNVPIAFIVVAMLICATLDILLCIFTRKTAREAAVGEAAVGDGFNDVSVSTDINKANESKEKRVILCALSILIIFALAITIYLACTIGTW